MNNKCQCKFTPKSKCKPKPNTTKNIIALIVVLIMLGCISYKAFVG